MFILNKLHLTDEQIIQSALEYMTKFPNAGRNQVILHTRGDTNRVRKLVQANKIKLPPPQKAGSAWRNFSYRRNEIA